MSFTKSEVVVWAVVGAALCGVVALAVVARRGRESSGEPESAGFTSEKKSQLLPEPAGELGDFPFVERSGRAGKTSELRGKFVVADCIFTTCMGVCPAMSARMEDLQADVKSMDDVRLVSFTVDPDRDTPQALSEFAARYHADAERWLFARCEKPIIQEIGYDRIKLWKSKDDITVHSGEFALLDRAGQVRGFYSPLYDPKWKEKLLRDIDTLRHEPTK